MNGKELAIRNARELTALVKRCEADPNYSKDALKRLQDRRDEAQAIVEEDRS